MTFRFFTRLFMSSTLSVFIFCTLVYSYEDYWGIELPCNFLTVVRSLPASAQLKFSLPAAAAVVASPLCLFLSHTSLPVHEWCLTCLFLSRNGFPFARTLYCPISWDWINAYVFLHPIIPEFRYLKFVIEQDFYTSNLFHIQYLNLSIIFKTIFWRSIQLFKKERMV